MKKVLVILSVLALTLVPVFAGAKVAAVGLEAGFPAAGITADFDIGENFDVYTTVGYGYSAGSLRLGAGAQYKVADFKIEKASFDVLAGFQVCPEFVFTGEQFGLGAYGTVALSYDFKIKTEGKPLKFNTFIKAALGYDMYISSEFSGAFGFGISAGLLYKF